MKTRPISERPCQTLVFPGSIDLNPEQPRTFHMEELEISHRLFRFLLHSAILPENREVSVYVPPQYSIEPQRRFPVFFLHDGQNLYDERTSYIPGHTWNIHSTTDRLTAAREIEPVILVGIANTGVRRMADYTPTEDARMGGGDGLRYAHLLVEELKPWLDTCFRTRTGAPDTAVGGSSLGGLISLYLGLRFPQVFGKLAILSPSIWWDQRSILNMIPAFDAPQRPRIWLDIGTAEGGRHVRDTDLLHRLLLLEGWRDNADVLYRKFLGGTHTEDAWAARFDQVLRFLFAPISTT